MKAPGSRYAWYATAVLMIAYTFSFLDRQILNLMVGPIEHDLGISDSQFAILTGGAFGIFYTIMGLPLGWMADRLSRKWIVTAGIACWSLMTAACGVAGSFAQLMLTRVGVGVGEATLSPSAYSMLSDYFDKARLPRAMGIYTCGIFIGAGTAMIAGGAVVDMVRHTPVIHFAAFGVTRSWQLVFVIVGLPGLLLALWLATLREPIRRDHGADSQAVARVSSSFREGLGELGAFLARYPRMCIALFLGSALFSILGYTDAWYPGALHPHLGLERLTIGPGQRRLIAHRGPVGVDLRRLALELAHCPRSGGRLSTTHRVRSYRHHITGGTHAVGTERDRHGVVSVAVEVLRGLSAGVNPFGNSDGGAEPPTRPAGALFLFTVGIIGVSCGPLLPALFNDYVFKSHDSLRYSIAWSTGLVGPLACITLWSGVRQYRTRFHEMYKDQ